MLVHFGMSPWEVLRRLLTFGLYRQCDRLWYVENPPPVLHAYAITREGARRWVHAIEHNFFDRPLHRHEQGVITVYVAHRASRWSDFFRILALRDMSHITDNPEALRHTV